MATPQLPNLELIQSMHKFPGHFTFKVIGDTRDDFVSDALTLAMSALGQDRDYNHSVRNSAAGNHTALTLTIALDNAHEVHAIYTKLLTLVGLRAIF